MGRRKRLLLTRENSEAIELDDELERQGIMVREFDSVRQELLRGRGSKLIKQFRHVGVRTTLLELMPQPLKTALVARLLSRSSCWIEDEYGRREQVTWRRITQLAMQTLQERLTWRRMLKRVAGDVRRLAAGPDHRSLVNRQGRPIYIRSDLSFRVRSGGSVAHVSGVLNNLAIGGKSPLFITTDPMPNVDPQILIDVIRPERRWTSREGLASFAFNERLNRQAEQRLCRHVPAFLYQRYSLNNFSGVALSREFGIPLVLEYNGSEIWISRNWGKPLPFEALSSEIEQLNLQAADLIVVVSTAMQQELIERGVNPDRILVNPNGVDTDRYRPDVSGESVRRKLGWEEQTVVGFIGTFGAWHGAETLVAAFADLLENEPQRRSKTRLLMIGDGERMPAVRELRQHRQLTRECHLTGLIPQSEGPAHLAACDILVAPHVPNPDGTPFFGSPTKLFEYMAMGRGVVASNLDQIGDVLEDGETGRLVTPGDQRDLATGIRELLDQPQIRHRYGQAARRKAVAEHSWRSHTQKILDALEDRCGGRTIARAA